MYFYKPDDDSIRSKHVAFLYENNICCIYNQILCCTVVLFYINVVRKPVILQISLQRFRNYFQLCFIELPLYEKKYQ